ncbi:MAG TPA: hypothetical protein VMV22_14530 [Acidimicrobiales bacterium]|nr:hypothetical protein [Acidimicrobiales bacterium]
MRMRLRNLFEAARQLSGTGATNNAHLEVDRAARSVVELDRQLRRVCDPTPRRAA